MKNRSRSRQSRHLEKDQGTFGKRRDTTTTDVKLLGDRHESELYGGDSEIDFDDSKNRLLLNQSKVDESNLNIMDVGGRLGSD